MDTSNIFPVSSSGESLDTLHNSHSQQSISSPTTVTQQEQLTRGCREKRMEIVKEIGKEACSVEAMMAAMLIMCRRVGLRKFTS